MPAALVLFFFAPVAILTALVLATGRRCPLPALAQFAVGLCLACLATAALHTR